MEQKIRKPVAWLLTLAMLFTMLPSFTFTALAADNICAHHAEHTAECGYVEGVSDCAYHCHVCHVQELIDALPGDVTAENADTVAAHLDAIDLAKAELTADELALLDLTKYTAAAQALGALAAAEVTCDCGTDDALIHATTCAVYVAPENPVCYCTEKCSDTNVWCDVCGFDYTQCGGTDTATVYADAWFTVSGNTVTIDGTLGNKDTATEDEVTALVDAITGYVGSGITTITVTGSNPAIIDMGQYTSTAIGEAIYRLSGSGYEANSTYLGKIDLILSDVTEIVDYEFQDAHALNSINLPKVTTVGNNAFYHCWYLQELTFGSVVTSIKSNLAFSEVGASVDGGLCDLVLNHGQADAASEYQPNLPTNRWWNNFEWKRITLDHLGGVATCTAKAVCSYCGAGYGEVAPHSGGEATCTTQAVCDVCGTSYGEFAAHSFDDTTGFCNVCGSYQPAVLTTDKYDVNGDEVMDAVYEISNAGKLYWFAAVVNGGYGGVAQNKAANAVLTADIEINQDLLSSLTYDENGAVTNGTSFREWTPIGSVTNIYTGTFDGNNKTVSGLYFNDSATSYVGLFGYVGSGGTVKNVGVIDSYLSGYQGVGGVVGHNAGTVQSCYNSGTVSGSNYVGGVVGNNDGTVQNCYNTGTVSGSDYVGGVVGVNHGTVQSCYNTGTVSGSSDVGGVVGVNHDTVQSCYNTGAVTGGDYSSVGGVVGGNVGTVTNCYYNTETYTGNAIGKNDGTVDALTGGKTAAQFASGEVAYLLQAGQTAGEDGVIPEVWGQNIKTSDTDTEYDAYPTLGGVTVYYGYNSCAETATAIYTNDSTVTAEKPTHSGGTATCLGSQCTVCGAWYGDVDANNHASDECTYTANEDGTTHTKKYKCCGAVASANEEHTVTTWTQEGITHTGNCDHCGASVSGYCDKDTATGKCKVCGNLIPVLSVTSGETVTYYPNVDDVLKKSASVLKSGDTVRLLDDCYGDDYLTIPEGVTFDGGNFTLNLGYFELENNGTITGGTFEYDVTGFVSNKSTGTITGGTFICDVDNSGTITGGNFTSVTIYSAGSSISGNLTITEMLKLGLNFYPSIGEGIIDLSNATLGGGTEGADVIALDSSNLSEEWNWNSEDENVVKLKLPEGYCVLVHDYETGEDVYTETLNSETRNCYIRKHSHTLEGYGYDGDSHWTTCSCGYADKTTEAAHTPTYSASGSTITMSCSVCGANGTAAISATGKTYDGDAVEATVTKTGILENKTIAITYKVKDGAALQGAPANAGTYTASITMGDQTVSVEFTIAKATPEVTAPTVNPLTYNGQAQALVKAGSTTGGEMQYSTIEDGTYGGEVPTGTNAGTYTVWYKVVGGNNYEDHAGGSVSVTIEPKKLTELTFVGLNEVYAHTGSKVEPGFTVKDGDTTLTVNTDYTVAFADNTDVGTATITITLKGNYSGTVTKTFDIKTHVHDWSYALNDAGDTITATCEGNIGTCPDAEQSVTLNASDAVYSGNPVNAAVTRDGTDLTDTLHYTSTDGYASSDAPANAGTYTVTMTVGDKSVEKDFTISPKNIANCDASLAEGSFTYTGTAPELTVTVVDSGVGNTTLTKDTDYTVGAAEIDAGSHKLTITGAGNYTGTVELEYNITAKAITPTVEGVNASYTYTGKAIQPTVTVKDGNTVLAAGTDCDVTYGENKNAGTGTVTVTLKGNYSGSKTVDFAISKATLTVTADNKTMTTGYALPTFTYTITGFVNGETENVLTAKPVAKTSTDGQTAGTYDIIVSGAAADNYDFTYVNGTLSVVEHQHDWTYTAEDGTITATCGNEDTCPDKVQTITISAEGKTYDGTAVVAKLDGSIDGVTTPTISYSGNTDAGTHTASITMGEGENAVTASVEFTIAKTTIGSVSITVTAPAAGEKPQTTVTAGTGYSAEIEWKETVTQFGFNTAYTATVTLTADSNHKFASELAVDGWMVSNTEGVLTLTKTFDATRKAKLTELTGAPADKTLTGYYTAVSGAIAELPTTVTYTTESGNVTVAIGWTCDNYNSAPKATDTFAWSVKNGELDNYDVNGKETSGTITVTNVDALPVTNTGSDTEITYDGNTYDVSKMFTKDSNAGEASYAITGGTGTGTLNGSTLTITKAGTIEITMTTAANDPYAAGSVTATLTVKKAAGAGSVAMDDWTYGETAKAPTTENGTGAATFLYTGNGYSSAEVPTDAGTYTVTATFAATDLYEQATDTDTFTIAQKELTATISGSVTKTYDKTNAVPAGHGLSIALNTPITDDDVTASATYAYDGVNVGTTKINATGITLGGADASNYKLTNTTASADVGTITKAAAPAIVWPTASSLIYGQTLSASTLTSTDSNGTFAWKNGSTVPTVTNNGYVVVYTPKDTGNYDYSNVTLEKTISVTVTAADQADFSISGATTATYGDAPITLNAAGGSGTGTITWEITSGDQFASIDQNGVVTIKGAGTVTVKATKAADGNYKEKVDTHQITISKATVDADNFDYKAPTDLVYSKTEKAATVTGDEAYGAITIKYYSDSSLTTVVQPINVGTYYVGITTAGGNNYEAVTAPMYVGSFEITARTVTVTAAAKTMQYGDDVPELTYTHNLLEGDSFTGSLATTATKTSDVGEYDITIGDLANSNYSISFTGAKLTITKADGPAAPTVTGSYVDNGMTYTYTVDAITGAEYSKDGTTWQDSNVFANLVAGQKYTFYARIKETTNVLAGDTGKSAEVDLSKLPGKGTVTIDDWTYGETAQAPVTGSTTGNAVESYLYESTDGKGYSSANAPTDAGEYKLTVTFAATDTHNGTTASDTFTIKKATPVVDAPAGLTATYGDTLADVQLETGWAWKDAGTTEVGNAGENTFTVIYTHPTDAANHEQVEKTVTITVAPKAVTATVTVVGENFIFNGSEQKPGVTVKDGDITIPESEYTVSYKDNTNAGTATVTITDKDGGNYTVTGETTFAIAKKASSALSGVEREFMRTIATTGNEIDVEAMLPDDHGTTTYTVTSSGYTVLENVAVDANGKLVFDTKTSAAAASDTITVKVEMQNYTDVTLTVSVVLNDKAPQEITGVTAQTGLIYNGEAQQGYTGTPASDYTGAYEITYTGRDNSYNSSAAPVNAGDYTVTFKIPDSDLYYSGNISINFTIGKAQATVTADDKEAYIGSRMPELTYKVSGLIGSDTISVELSCDANMNRAGETPIVVTATDPNGNYEITTVNGTLTVKYYPYIPSTPSNPPATEVTVPISGDDNTIHVEAEVSGDKAIIDHVDLDHLDEVIGDHVDTGTVTIDFSGLDTKEPITTVEIPANVVKEIASAVNDPNNDADSLEIILSDGTSIEFDAEALGEKAAQARGQDITISIESHEDVRLTNAQKNALGNRPAYDINVTSGGKHISDMGGKITVHAPYELKSGEKAEGIVVYYVDENGNRERCETSYDPIKKRVNWKTDHLSLYMIDYDESLIENCKKDKTCPMYSFTDLDMTAWYHDGVHFCIANDLMNGTSTTTFAPGMTTSRAMIVTILWRLEGEPTVNGGAAFSDVANGKWYSEAIKWAAANNIVNGYGNGLFGPDDIITREQLATILYRYEQYKGGGFTGAWMIRMDYVDLADVSDWAYEAMCWMNMNGIVNGKPGKVLDPKGSATRAEAATMLYRYCEVMTKEDDN